MKNAELAEATSWRIPDFDDATRVAREETKNHRVDKKTQSASLRPDH